MTTSAEHLKTLPSVSAILEHLSDLQNVNRTVLTALVREEVAHVREELVQGGDSLSRDALIAEISRRVRARLVGSPQHIINATGIVLHTGFGRAPLDEERLLRVSKRVVGYSNLEFDLPSGKRGNRLDHISTALKALTGAEAVAVVNNNAAAVLLTLNALAEGKDVVVSRGQEVEIGGSFRIPDIIRKSGARMVEVGTTNRTHLRDYEEAIQSSTGCLLWVHTSNYRVQGFTHSVALKELSQLGRKKRIPVVADLGSGALIELETLGLPSEPTVASVVRSGADVVTFSGDKLLGGPQAGLIVGKRRWIRKIIRDPIYRAVRCDKLTLALLWDTLVYSQPDTNLAQTLLSTPREMLRRRAQVILEQVNPRLKERWSIHIRETEVEAGSGSLPTENLPSVALVFTSSEASTADLAQQLRLSMPPVVGFIHRRALFLDMKAILPNQDPFLVQALNALEL